MGNAEGRGDAEGNIRQCLPSGRTSSAGGLGRGLLISHDWRHRYGWVRRRIYWSGDPSLVGRLAPSAQPLRATSSGGILDHYSLSPTILVLPHSYFLISESAEPCLSFAVANDLFLPKVDTVRSFKVTRSERASFEPPILFGSKLCLKLLVRSVWRFLDGADPPSSKAPAESLKSGPMPLVTVPLPPSLLLALLVEDLASFPLILFQLQGRR
jgi:hypothetical protein